MLSSNPDELPEGDSLDNEIPSTSSANIEQPSTGPPLPLVDRAHEDVPYADHYPINSSPIGLALVISNIYFERLESRELGGHEDYETITKLLQDLNFSIYTKMPTQNLTISQMRNTIGAFSKERHNDFSCCLVCIMTHGISESDIYGTLLCGTNHIPGTTDCVSAKWMIDQFSVSNCPGLSGKPKIFLIQACRGQSDNISQNVPFSETSTAGLPFSGRRVNTTATGVSMSGEPSITPEISDVFMVFGTTPGCVSYRESRGSLFIQTVSDVIREKHQTEDLQSMMTDVFNRMSSMAFSQEERAVQVPETLQVQTSNKIMFPINKEEKERRNLEFLLRRLDKRRCLLVRKTSDPNFDISFADRIASDTYNVVLEKKRKRENEQPTEISRNDFITTLQEKLSIGATDSVKWQLKTDFQSFKGRKTIIVGVAGSGKTTLCAQIVSMYVNGSLRRGYEKLAFLELRRLSNEKKDTAKYTKEKFLRLFDYNDDTADSKVLYILDGFDEIVNKDSFTEWSNNRYGKQVVDDEKTELGWILHIMRHSENVIVSTRPSALSALQDVFDEDQVLHVVGFSDTEIEQVFTSRNLTNALESIRSNAKLYVHLCVPVTCMMVIALLEENEKMDIGIMKSDFEIYLIFTVMQLAYHCRLQHINRPYKELFSIFQYSFKQLLDTSAKTGKDKQDDEVLYEVLEVLHKVSELAHKVVRHNFTLTKHELAAGKVNKDIEIAETSGVFAVEDVHGYRYFPRKNISPIHNTIAEFLSALYLFAHFRETSGVFALEDADNYRGSSRKYLSPIKNAIAGFLGAAYHFAKMRVATPFESVHGLTSIERRFFISMLSRIEPEIKARCRRKHWNLISIVHRFVSKSHMSEEDAIEIAADLDLNSEWFEPVVTRALKALCEGDMIGFNDHSNTPRDNAARLTLLEKAATVGKIVPATKLSMGFSGSLLPRLVLNNSALQTHITCLELDSLGEPLVCWSPLRKFERLREIVLQAIAGLTALLDSLPLGIEEISVCNCSSITFESEQPKLKQFTRLKKMLLRGVRMMNDEGLTNLLNSLPPTITWLWLGNCGLTFASEQPAMRNLTQLKYLDVRENKDIDQKGLDNLFDCIPDSLEKLWLPDQCKEYAPPHRARSIEL